MKYLKAFFGAFILILIDQWTKYMVLLHIKPVSSIPLIPGVLSFTYHENRGAVWGIMQGQIPVLILSTIIILANTGYQKIYMAASCLCTCHIRGHRKLY